MSGLAILGINGAAVAALMLGAWVLSLRLRDTSVVDVFWGAGFALVALLTCVLSSGAPSRRALVASLALIWGLRLATHIGLRNLGKPEDRRYRAMRDQHGDAWPMRSLVTVFGLQGLLIVLISAPLQVAQLPAEPGALGIFDYLGAALWLVGFTFETVADAQLTRFKQDPANSGRVMDRGLWRYSRHPNYFGDAVVWWGFYVIAAGVPGGLWTLPAPLVMTWLLRRVSGVPLLERDMANRRAGYAEYVRRTPAFFPWIPREP